MKSRGASRLRLSVQLQHYFGLTYRFVRKMATKMRMWLILPVTTHVLYKLIIIDLPLVTAIPVTSTNAVHLTLEVKLYFKIQFQILTNTS